MNSHLELGNSTSAAPASTPVGDAFDATVRADIEAFRKQATDHLEGRLTMDEFRPFRLRRGVYTQRQTGVYMIRTKIPGGVATAAQVHQLAQVSEKFAAGKAHLTTRQNVQYHFVPLQQVPDALHMLADQRLTTREACYNTVRNVTATPYAGLAADEPFDVLPYARRTAFAFLHKELTDSLPRKFKIAFTSGEKDAAAADINDVGLRAVVRNVNGVEERGFRMVIAGGLGPLPCEPRVLDEFLPADQLIPRIEAVIRLFNKHGNRSNKNKARLKFVLRERGFDWVRETIEAEYKDILENGGITTPSDVPDGFGGWELNPVGRAQNLPVLDSAPAETGFEQWRATNVQVQRQAGFFMATVKLPQGNLTAEQLHVIADLSLRDGDGLVRFTIDQNLLLAFLPEAHLKRFYATLRANGLAEAGANTIDDVVSCPGAYSCNLALTKSMNLGDALSNMLKAETDTIVRTLNVHISGCPNSCGQHWTGDFGFYGNARKIDGKEVPYYLMMLGGGFDRTGSMKYGLAVQSVPARLVPVAVRRVLDHFVTDRKDGESFREYVMRNRVEFFKKMTADLTKPAPDADAEMFQDWGDDSSFSLQLGRGECAA